MRIPLIPGVTDSTRNLTQLAQILNDNHVSYAELLPYNKMAGGKYKMLQRNYMPGFDETAPPSPARICFGRLEYAQKLCERSDCMTEKIELQLKQLNSKAYQTKRKHIEDAMFDDIKKSENFINNFQKIVSFEDPCFLENDEFGFNRSTDLTIPPYGGNVTPNYYRIISQGFDAVLDQIGKAVAKTTDAEKKAYGKNMAKCIQLCLEFCSQYKTAAKASGNLKLYGALKKVPHKGAETFYEACVFLKISIYFLRISFVDHLGLGRFDQYMYPFYLHDKACGVQDNRDF